MLLRTRNRKLNLAIRRLVHTKYHVRTNRLKQAERHIQRMITNINRSIRGKRFR